jgi:hypothetical protein
MLSRTATCFESTQFPPLGKMQQARQLSDSIEMLASTHLVYHSERLVNMLSPRV